MKGNLIACYSPVRYEKIIKLACVKYKTSVHSEPGSNSLKV